MRRYGVSVVSYTWAMLREVIDDPNFVLQGNHPVRLFIGSGMPIGLWNRVTEVFAPANVVEFFATKDGQAVLANVSGAKVGSKGRPLPGAVEVELAAYDSELDLILEDDRGFVRVAETDEVGVLLAKPRGPIDPAASVKRGVFAPADTWISTEFLFRRDADGDYWLVGGRSSRIATDRGSRSRSSSPMRSVRSPASTWGDLPGAHRGPRPGGVGGHGAGGRHDHRRRPHRGDGGHSRR